MFETWGEALGSYLDDRFGRRGSRKKLAKMILSRDAGKDKITSKASEIGRWINQGVTPIDRTKEEIHNLLNICISQNEHGKWEIKRTNNGKPSDEQSDSSEMDELTNQALQLARLLKSDKSAEPELDDRIRGLELAELMIRLVKESLKKESSD